MASGRQFRDGQLFEENILDKIRKHKPTIRLDQLAPQPVPTEIEIELMDQKNLFPLGFRFCPTDEELLTEYLMKELLGEPYPPHTIRKLDFYVYGPHDLSALFRKPGEKIMYFFSCSCWPQLIDNGPDRLAGTGVEGYFQSDGYWKCTNDMITIGSKENPVGYKKTFVYYQGKLGFNAKETNWILEEYTLEEKLLGLLLLSRILGRETITKFVICKVYNKYDIQEEDEPSKSEWEETQDQISNCNCNCSTFVCLLYDKFMCCMNNLILRKYI